MKQSGAKAQNRTLSYSQSTQVLFSFRASAIMALQDVRLEHIPLIVQHHKLRGKVMNVRTQGTIKISAHICNLFGPIIFP